MPREEKDNLLQILETQLSQHETELENLNHLNINKLTTHGKYGEAIQCMLDTYDKEKDLGDLSGQFHSLEREYSMFHRIKYEDYIIHRNKISGGFQIFYKQFESDIVSKIKQSKKQIEAFKTKQAKINHEINKKNISCAILVSSHTKVMKHLSKNSKKWAEIITPNRYADTGKHLFTEEESIERILDVFKNKTGYDFKIEYLDGALSLDKRRELEKNRATIVLLVDPLSLLCADNQSIAKIFDHQESGGIVIPICSTLLEKKSSEYIKQTIRETFSTLHELRQAQLCAIYYPFLADRNCLEQSLRAIFAVFKSNHKANKDHTRDVIPSF